MYRRLVGTINMSGEEGSRTLKGAFAPCLLSKQGSIAAYNPLRVIRHKGRTA